VKHLPQPAAQAGAVPDPARATLAQLLRILQDEGRALVAGDAEALAQAVQHKGATLRQLAAELGRGDGASALGNAVRRARDLNERNARLLAPHLNMNRARLETLFGGGRGALYLADGRAAQPLHRAPQRGVRA
jgi:flagellar biosynthesis/type III secretory pathway chaperone